ncbi:FlgB family protein [Fuscibacter oryzae]|nr:FlgB family protein [Fuscibacter oryzae]
MKQVTGEARMFESLKLTAMAQAMAAHAGSRMGLIARNVANADTPGYRALDIPSFSEIYKGGGAFDAGSLADMKAGKALPFIAPGDVEPNGNSVSVEVEMVKAAEARQEQEMALAIYRSASGIIRASLGRT